MSIHVLPTAPSPTVTHLMNREALDAMAARVSLRFSEPREGEKRERGAGEETVLEGGTESVLAFFGGFWCVTSWSLGEASDEEGHASEEGHMPLASPVTGTA